MDASFVTLLFAFFVICVILAVFAFVLVRYYEDADEREWLVTATCVIGLTTALAIAFLIPLDVYLTSRTTDHRTGLKRPWATPEAIELMRLVFKSAYYVLYTMIGAGMFVVVPWVYFYHEEGGGGDITFRRRALSATKYTIATFLVAGMLIAAGLLLKNRHDGNDDTTLEWVKKLLGSGFEIPLISLLGIVTTFGTLCLMTYTALGMSILPLKLISSRTGATGAARAAKHRERDAKAQLDSLRGEITMLKSRIAGHDAVDASVVSSPIHADDETRPLLSGPPSTTLTSDATAAAPVETGVTPSTGGSLSQTTSRLMQRRDLTRLHELEQQERELSLRLSNLQHLHTRQWSTLYTLLRPFQILLGTLLLLLTTNLILASTLANISKLVSSFCKSHCGYLLDSLPSSRYHYLNTLFVWADRLFPLDYLLYGLLTLLLLFSTLSALTSLSLRFPFLIPMPFSPVVYFVRKSETPAQGVLVMTVVLMGAVVGGVWMTAGGIMDGWAAFGRQDYCPLSPSQCDPTKNPIPGLPPPTLIPCTYSSPTELCTPTSISSILNFTTFTFRIFGVMWVYAQLILAVIFVGGLVGGCIRYLGKRNGYEAVGGEEEEGFVSGDGGGGDITA
ncbi:hypothetical protein DFS34DRAFT_688604 [Phlyctochytrium arcticum]|nr:hypothetical protein DFS34DRAFT_688604 [Phlyctochytrium arcticum]